METAIDLLTTEFKKVTKSINYLNTDIIEIKKQLKILQHEIVRFEIERSEIKKALDTLKA